MFGPTGSEAGTMRVMNFEQIGFVVAVSEGCQAYGDPPDEFEFFFADSQRELVTRRMKNSG